MTLIPSKRQPRTTGFLSNDGRNIHLPSALQPPDISFGFLAEASDDWLRTALSRMGEQLYPENKFRVELRMLNIDDRVGYLKNPPHSVPEKYLRYADMYWYPSTEQITVSFDRNVRGPQTEFSCSLPTCRPCTEHVYRLLMPAAIDLAWAEATAELLAMLTTEKLRQGGILP